MNEKELLELERRIKELRKDWDYIHKPVKKCLTLEKKNGKISK